MTVVGTTITATITANFRVAVGGVDKVDIAEAAAAAAVGAEVMIIKVEMVIEMVIVVIAVAAVDQHLTVIPDNRRALRITIVTRIAIRIKDVDVSRFSQFFHFFYSLFIRLA